MNKSILFLVLLASSVFSMNITSGNYSVGWTTTSAKGAYVASTDYTAESTITLYPAQNESSTPNYTAHVGFFPPVQPISTTPSGGGGGAVSILPKPLAQAVEKVVPGEIIKTPYLCEGSAVLGLLALFIFWKKKRTRREEQAETA